MTKQRYRAVMQVHAGSPVVEVAEQLGVSRQAVHRWLNWYGEERLAGLADRSHRPNAHLPQTSPEVEAAVCECAVSIRGGDSGGCTSSPSLKLRGVEADGALVLRQVSREGFERRPQRFVGPAGVHEGEREERCTRIAEVVLRVAVSDEQVDALMRPAEVAQCAGELDDRTGPACVVEPGVQRRAVQRFGERLLPGIVVRRGAFEERSSVVSGPAQPAR